MDYVRGCRFFQYQYSHSSYISFSYHPRILNFSISQLRTTKHGSFLCLWFRASLIYINNCPTRCNTKQAIYYSASSLHVFRVSTKPITRNAQNCNYNLRYWFFFLCSSSLQRGHALPRWREELHSIAWPVLEAVVTVLCTHDGCGWHPKRVEWTCRIINRLLCFASRWAVIDIKHLSLSLSQYRHIPS